MTSITSMAQWHLQPNGGLEETKWFFAVLDVSWALTVMKLAECFCINICCFFTRFHFLYQGIDYPVHMFDLHIPMKQKVDCVVSRPQQLPRKRFCGRRVDTCSAIWAPKFCCMCTAHSSSRWPKSLELDCAIDM